MYFIIKFQWSAFKMALKVLKKDDKIQYLFEEKVFRAYEPREEQFEEIKNYYIEHKRYFSSIKKSMQSRDSFKDIQKREPNRESPFSDLDNSIRAAYKVLLELRGRFEAGPSKT